MAEEEQRAVACPVANVEPELDDVNREKAAGMIQRTYRGHRERNAMKGFGLDPQTRWLELVHDARYQHITTPAPPTDSVGEPKSSGSPARSQWSRATHIARRAGRDDHSPNLSEVSSESLSDDGLSLEERKKQRERRARARDARKRTAKMMDLQYFLEMVDQKHRYGSSLRKYHNYWKSQDTKQNFFYWLDQGEGKDVELPECSRARLDKEQVRYLSRDERQNYLVKVDKEGMLVWAKNGERVWTKDELYKDSVKGIVPTADPTPNFQYNKRPVGQISESSTDSEEDENDEENEEGRDQAEDEAAHYANEEFHRAKGPAKLKHISAAALFNHMVRDSIKKGRKWIFVADTSFRLYVGYKQSGSFQHSSFLHGSRITAAGLIKIKRGQLRSLAPLSGHYRPPVNNFREFVHSLREEGVDMSRLNISKSYAILIGMESYTRAKKKVEKAEHGVLYKKDKLLHPAKVKSEEEKSKDKSQSAEKERQFLEQQRLQRQREEKDRKNERSLSNKLNQTFSRLKGSRETGSETGNVGEVKNAQVKRIPGTGPEDGIPAPEGKR